MPRRDGMGPEGNGPMTGRGVGNCASDKPNGLKPFSRNSGIGTGTGRGMGMGSKRGMGIFSKVRSNANSNNTNKF